MRFLSLFLPFFLIACSSTSTDEGTVGETNNSTDVAADYAQAFEEANELQLFFKEDQSVATFLGEGNEFATFTETTEWLDDQHVQITIDNGGTTIYRIYTIAEDVISLVYEDVTPPTADVNNYPQIEEFMRLPIEVGTSFGDWTITEIGMTIDTPFETFTDVVEVSNESADQISRRYYAKTFGLIMQLDQMKVEDELYEVRSSLDTMTFRQ